MLFLYIRGVVGLFLPLALFECALPLSRDKSLECLSLERAPAGDTQSEMRLTVVSFLFQAFAWAQPTSPKKPEANGGFLGPDPSARGQDGAPSASKPDSLLEAGRGVR